ncbi:MAG: iron-sulfur cluster assembly scaffold protein [Acidobacteriia bacterium]|nr:iron-sulfur cluster assembly scaffold protein [Terriglobia bacterium]MYG03396.1 iron-sulfur cluster assembly scaffold protein [Terriglobia bacterium]MYK12001.1 iron-sulfur cluster assembly scaffold protein [Terriglobia bacterium]
MFVFSETLLDHFRNPRRVGSLDPPAVTVRVENPVCGDILTLSASVGNGVVREVRFKARGCTASIAAGSVLTDLISGVSRVDLRKIDASKVEAALGGLPNESKHVARLASDAASALADRLAAP